jgi:hypothetical protein
MGDELGKFKRTRGGGVRVSFDETEAAIIRGLLDELMELLDEEDSPPIESDPLAAQLGIGTATKAPDDPVLARLFPDGYSGDDEASSDFRRYTEHGLREGKRASARTVLATLDVVGRSQRLTPDQAQAWLTTLNDLRLAIGTRLGVTEDWDHDISELAADDPRRYPYAVYDHLTYLQETLVQALM